MLVNIVLKCLLVYTIVFICLKIMGKREIGQVSLFDFAIILIISDILVIGIEEDNKYLFYFSIGVFFLTIVQRIISYIILKNKKIRTVFDGKESILIYDGKLNIKEMKRQRYNMDDLITQVRLKNIASLSEIKYLILENNGNISVFKYNDNPLCPLPLIVSGNIEFKNLKLLNIKEEWIYSKIKEKNIKLNEIYYASYENDNLFIIPINK